MTDLVQLGVEYSVSRFENSKFIESRACFYNVIESVIYHGPWYSRLTFRLAEN